MEPNSEIESYIAQYQSQGQVEGEGDFTLDPRRALEILTEQGSIASHAPLFLFRAIFQHTGGATVSWSRVGISFSYQLCWPARFGPLPNGPMRILAEGAFKTNALSLSFRDNRVVISRMDSSLSIDSVIKEAFQLAQDRLKHYPVEGLYQLAKPASPWRSGNYPEGLLELRRLNSAPRAVHFVVDGIEFTETNTLPLNVTVFDNGLKCDLSLTRIPDTERKKMWTERAKEFLLQFLEKVFNRQEPIRLDFEHLTTETSIALEFLPFVVALPPTHQLRSPVLDVVEFRDVFGQYWSLTELLRQQEQYGPLYVVEKIPRRCPQTPLGERPVLHWRGDTRRFGAPVFEQTRSGDGYLYSLSLGGVEIDAASIVDVVESEEGNLALLQMGTSESRCEVKLVGKRRASETLYLDPPAPAGLRLLWRSRDELASWDPTRDFLDLVTSLVDKALPRLEVDDAWIRSFLEWTQAAELNKNLRERAFLETVGGDTVSPKTLQDTFGREPVPVLEERSASLPEELPFSLLVWDDPLLQQLGFSTREESSAVRKAYWREDGKRRWLSRYEPVTLQQWGRDEGLALLPVGDHWLARADDGGASRLVVWRQGRPLGQSPLTECRFPPGYVLIYVDDDFPADQYWSGPDRDALARLGPWIETMKRAL